jgi:glycosyltransferase involved in cell wall biosynthesis
MSRPLFSILLPSRNRAELLRHAVNSVLEQGFGADAEIIVADNASDPSYGPYVASLGAIAARSVRSDVSLPVTENWNRALAASTGRYIIMLGDDDALAPGWLARARALIAQFDEPAALYVMAYHYCYPGVIPGRPDGYFATVDNADVFRDATAPYALPRDAAASLGAQVMRFRHRFSFNAQHFVWSRAFIDSLDPRGGLFQSPYPDYHAAILTMAEAPSVVVVPTPEVIIGISPKSFGFFYQNRQFGAGQAMLGNDGATAALGPLPEVVQAALAFPGSAHYRNWLIAALAAARSLGQPLDEAVDLRRYRRLQMIEMLVGGVEDGMASSHRLALLTPHLHSTEKRLVARLRWLDRLQPRLPLDRADLLGSLSWMRGIYTRPEVTSHDIGRHRSIADAYRWLAHQRPEAAALATPAAPPIPVLEPVHFAPGGPSIAVVYLARSGDGSVADFHDFIESYRRHQAGIAHDLIIICKGLLGRPGARAALTLMLQGIPHRTVDVSDEGYDIQAYLKLAPMLRHDRVCFFNTFSCIEAPDWLRHLNAALDRPGIGMAGATASFESLRSSLALVVRVIWLTAVKNIQYSPRIARQYGEMLSSHAPDWMAKRGNLLRQIKRELARPLLGRAHNTKALEAGFLKYLDEVSQPDAAFAHLPQVRPFPNPHLRSNAFIIDRALLVDFDFRLENTKGASQLFECGVDGLPARLAARGLGLLLVGADGIGYEVAEWPRSRTFRLGDQSNVLVTDNQVRAFGAMSYWQKVLHERISWGDYVPGSGKGLVDFGARFPIGSLEITPPPASVRGRKAISHTDREVAPKARIATPAHPLGLSPARPGRPSALQGIDAAAPTIPVLDPVHVAPDGPSIAVVYLARSGNGAVGDFQDFIESYRRHDAGITHDLIIIRKGLLDRPAAQAALAMMLEGIPHRTVDVGDEGYDIQAYLKLTPMLRHDRVCFFNTFSRIEAPRWLAKLNAPLDRPDVGVTGATAFFQSLDNSIRLFTKVFWLTAVKDIQYSPMIDAQYREQIASGAPGWLAKRGGWLRCVMREAARPWLGRPINSKMLSAGFLKYWDEVTQPGGTWSIVRHVRPFPNPNLRSNAFMMDRALLVDLDFRLDDTKEAALLFESGFDGLAPRLARRGLAPVLVGADGRAFDIEDWPESRTFRLGDQDNVMVTDNQVRAFTAMSAWQKVLHTRTTWGDYLTGSGTGLIDLGVPFPRGNLEIAPSPVSDVLTTDEATPRPLLSVVVPFCAGLEALGETLDSVARQPGNWECVILDNASTEGVAEHVCARADPRFRLAQVKERLELAASWNNAISAARGTYLLLLQPGHALAPDHGAQLVGLIDEFKQPEMIFCAFHRFVPPGVVPSVLAGEVATARAGRFFHDRPIPFHLWPEHSLRSAADALEMRRDFATAMPCFCFRRDFLMSLARDGAVFRTARPDEYIATLAMALGIRIIVTPQPLVILGDANEGEGEDPAQADAAGLLPGPRPQAASMLAMMETAARLGDRAPADAGLARYRRHQILAAATGAAGGMRWMQRPPGAVIWPKLTREEKLWALRITLTARLQAAAGLPSRHIAALRQDLALNPVAPVETHRAIGIYARMTDFLDDLSAGRYPPG